MRQCLGNFALFSDYRGTLTVRGKRAVISLETVRQPTSHGLATKRSWC